jgi:putative ABC transport system permease protein
VSAVRTRVDSEPTIAPNGHILAPIAEPVAEATDWSIVLGPLPDEGAGSMALGQSFTSALEALRGNKLRAFLTALGIIIGVGAVIVMVALGEGAQASVQSRLARLGTNLLTITPGSARVGGVRTGGGGQPTLTELDVKAIQSQVANVSAISPNLDGNGVQVVANNQNWNTRFQANYPSIFQLQDWQINQGAAFDDADESSGALVAVIGQTVATNLFGTANPVGQRIMIRNVPFTVKGTLVSKGSNGFQDQDDLILLPFSTAQTRLLQRSSVNDVYVQVNDPSQLDAVTQDMTTLLDTRHHIRAGQPDDFQIRNNNQIIQTVQATSSTFTFLLAGVAAVSLIVGGIGIMNIMLVSVTERTREIGIRMAVGARKWNILSQFLTEAVLLSAAGGLIGIAIGIGASIGMAQLAGWTTLVTPEAVLLSFGFAAVVGIFFGYYPAHKASLLNPIEALRYE